MNAKPTLSPATRAGLFTTLMERSEVKPSEIKTRAVYLCPECSEGHDMRSDALECCEPHIERATYYVCPTCDKSHEIKTDAMECCGCPGAAAPVRCPVCGREAGDYEDAADCCLWKDVGPFVRQRIARAVEVGSTWAEAIAAEAA